MSGTYASRNAAANGGPSSGVQQTAGSIGNGRFSMNNLPAALSQVFFIFPNANKLTKHAIKSRHYPVISHVMMTEAHHTNITL